MSNTLRPSAPKGIDWESQPLGQMSDHELARRLGVANTTVSRARHSRGIPAYRPAAQHEGYVSSVEAKNEYYVSAPPRSMAGFGRRRGSTVGIIGDTHLPFAVPHYLEFCRETFAEWGVDRVVHIGDLIENHAVSYHESDPDGLSAGDERAAALVDVQRWGAAFPRVTWIIGNHDRLPWRRAFTAGLPASVLRRNMYGVPDGWDTVESADIDGVLYTHGTGSGGENGHKNLARRRGVSCVIGHFHRVGGAHYLPTHDGQQRFGLAVGCGVQHDTYAQAWSKDFGRHALGCGIVRRGREAYYVPMEPGR